MRISQKLDYAHRALIQLAKSYDGKLVSKLDDISEREKIPSSFLVQIMTDLKKAGLVVSKRGKAGGYLLARDPAEVSLADVISAVEPQLLEDSHEVDGVSGPLVKAAWEQLSDVFRTKAKSLTLDSIMSTEKEPMWFI